MNHFLFELNGIYNLAGTYTDLYYHIKTTISTL
jgi:hypothetical protein